MKLVNLSVERLNELFQVIDNCTGKVELVGEDIRLNLKSKLAQYVSLANIFCDGEVKELELLTYNQEDTMRLIDFMMG